MVNTIIAVLEDPRLPSFPFPIFTIIRTRRILRNMVIGNKGRERETESIPPRITPCISI